MGRFATRSLWARGLVLLFIVSVSLSVWSDALVVADEASQSRGRTASGWAAKKDAKQDLGAVIQDKLQRILVNQQTILQRADAVKQELGIIKVHVTGSGRTLQLPSGVNCP